MARYWPNASFVTDIRSFSRFLRSIDVAVPAVLGIHVIIDKYATHKHAKVRARLPARTHWHVHFIPAYSSWLNLVERFFALITDRTIRRGSFRCLKELIGKIDHVVSHHNQGCKAFTWTATADSILSKLQ